MVVRPSRRFGCGQEDLPKVPRWSGGPAGCRERSGGLPLGLGVYRTGREALPYIRLWSGGLPGGPRVVGSSFWRLGSGQEFLQEV